MTVSSTTRKAGPFTGDGVVDTFPFAFKVFADADVLVVSADADGVETTLALDADYTVSLNPEQDVSPGGDVVMVAPLESGHTMIISSAAPLEQTTEITNSGAFSPAVLNQSLDKIIILAQQIQEAVSRALKVPITGTEDPDALVRDFLVAVGSAEAAAASAAQSAALIMSAAVRFDVAQTLTTEQKAQARANIKTIQFVDAATSADVPEITGQALIRVTSDENNGGFTTLYFQDGDARNWIPMVSV